MIVVIVVTNRDALRNYCRRDNEKKKDIKPQETHQARAAQLISRSNASLQGERLAGSLSVCESSSSPSGPCFSRNGVAKGEVGRLQTRYPDSSVTRKDCGRSMECWWEEDACKAREKDEHRKMRRRRWVNEDENADNMSESASEDICRDEDVGRIGVSGCGV
jgi:hypothetical protein